MNEKKKKILEKIIIICLIVILIEVIAMGIMKFVRERKIDHIKSLNNLIKIDDGYVGVGISDFHQNSFVDEKTYQFTDPISKKSQNIIATQSRIVKYDKDMNIIWENTYKSNYDSTFYDVLETDDGYVAVGSFASQYKQIEENTREAMIVKYNKDGKKLWDKTYRVLSDTEFYKIIEDEDNYVVIGQSIYENMELGNHITGGGIIVKYSKDGEELAHNNYGGNKSGIFNDIIKVDDGYIVCGKDAVNYGIIVKFKKDFNREENDNNLISKKVVWQRTYSNTDNEGFKAMVLVNDKIYAVGALNVSNEKDDEGNIKFQYDAGFVTYNINGKYIGKYVSDEEKHHQFNSVVSDGQYLYLSMLLDIDSYYKDGLRKSVIIKYDINEEKKISETQFDKDNNYVINKIKNIDDKYMIIGTTNAKCGFLGCDYNDIHEYIEIKD